MMYCIKHLMKLHPEYNEMIMPFYSRMYDLYPYNEDNPFDEKNGHPFNKRDVNETKHFADDFHEGLDGRTSDSQDKYNVIDGGLFESKIINNDRNRYGFPKEEKLYKRRSER